MFDYFYIFLNKIKLRMPKYTNVAIVASFLGLWIDSFFSHDVQIAIGFVLIFSFGIMHGANDLLLIENVNTKKQSFSYFQLLSYYIAMVLLVTLLFYFVAWLALILFLIVSAYHFGEQQWQALEFFSLWIRIAFQFCYGSFVLLLLFAFHNLEVQRIIFEISSHFISTDWMQYLLAFFSIMLIGLGSYLYTKSDQIRKQLLTELFYLIVFTILFKSSSLIWGFALYFVLWHSIPSIIDQIKFLYGTFSKVNVILYLKAALLYWMISLIGIATLYFLFKGEKIFNALFFSFLAAITFPHVLVIVKVFGKNSTGSIK